jgi:ABC-2 type transport system ATP-binding protein
VRKYEFKLGSSWDFNYQNLELCEWLRKYKVDVTGGGEEGEGTRWELWKKQLRKIPARAYKDKDFPGLDPKERVRFRNLIAGFAQDKVVILSTHIVSDVEFIANRILVMRQGSFVLDGTPEQVVKQAAGKVWECHVDARRAEGMSASLQVANVRYAPDGHAVVRVVADRPPMEGAVAVEPTLEDLYLLVFRDAGNR